MLYVVYMDLAINVLRLPKKYSKLYRGHYGSVDIRGIALKYLNESGVVFFSININVCFINNVMIFITLNTVNS